MSMKSICVTLTAGVLGLTGVYRVLAQNYSEKPLKQFQISGVEPKAADADSPLPVGFPAATPPGAIEVKTYPPYRSARARGEKMSLSSSDFLFWTLFRHIERNDIAMTAPVINTYPREMMDRPNSRGEVSMEFLYRDASMGKLGKDGKQVEVVDHPVETVVCLGIQGGMSESIMRDAMLVLDQWTKEHSAEWVVVGPPRRLGYHGPMTGEKRRLWELQVPIKASDSILPAAETKP